MDLRKLFTTIAVVALAFVVPSTCLAGWKVTQLGKGQFGSVAVGPDGITHLIYVKSSRIGNQMLHVKFSANGKRLTTEVVNGPDANYALPSGHQRFEGTPSFSLP